MEKFNEINYSPENSEGKDSLNDIEKMTDNFSISPKEFIENPDNQSKLDKALALKIIENGGADAILENIDKFEGLDKESAIKMIQKSGRSIS